MQCRGAIFPRFDLQERDQDLAVCDPLGSGPLASSSAGPGRGQVREALLRLGYAAREAEEALRALPAEVADGEPGAALKAALRSLEPR